MNLFLKGEPQVWQIVGKLIEASKTLFSHSNRDTIFTYF